MRPGPRPQRPVGRAAMRVHWASTSAACAALVGGAAAAPSPGWRWPWSRDRRAADGRAETEDGTQALAGAARGEAWMAGSGRARAPVPGELAAAAELVGGSPVPWVNLEELSTELLKPNLSHRRPFVLKGLVGRWPATRRWTWRRLVDPQGHYAAFSKSLAGALEAYFDSQEEAPEGQRSRRDETLFLEGLVEQEPFASDCPYAQVTDQSGAAGGVLGGNFLALLSEGWREVSRRAAEEGLVESPSDGAGTIHTYLIAGPAGSGGLLHVDPEGTAYWNAVVHGRKRWMFVEPSDLEALAAALPAAPGELAARVVAFSKGEPAARSRPLSRGAVLRALQHIPAMRWFGELLPLLTASNMTLPHQYAVVEAGELLYGPPGLFHIVLALADSIGCSEQVVDEANLADWVRDNAGEYDPEDAFLGCEAARKYWPRLLEPLKVFCARAEKDIRRLARRRRGSRSGGPGTGKVSGSAGQPGPGPRGATPMPALAGVVAGEATGPPAGGSEL